MEEEKFVPEVYADVFRFTVGPYGVTFTFSTSVPHPESGKVASPKEAMRLRMSLEQAKVLSMMLRKNLKNYENSNSLEIALPSQLYTQLGLSKENWD